MATNQFYPFAAGAGANVLTNAEYQALAARMTGFSSGIATSVQLNTAWRQASFVASMIGQFIADLSGSDANDDGNIAELETNFKAALTAQIASTLPGRLLRTTVLSAPGTTTFTPLPNATLGDVYVLGGGGAGGGAQAVTGSNVSPASGGTAGSWAIGHITLTGASLSATVGSGGTQATGAAGGAGGASSFGGIITAPGGPGGLVASPAVSPLAIGGVNGTVASGGSIVNTDGAPGGIGLGTSGTTGYGGVGAPSVLGGGGATIGQNANGISATAPGSGGGGTCATTGNGSLTGGAGAHGLIIIKEYS